MDRFTPILSNPALGGMFKLKRSARMLQENKSKQEKEKKCTPHVNKYISADA